jgi:glucose-6-phosphate 1-epimerase
MSNKYPVKNEFGEVKPLRLGADLQGLAITHQNCTACISLYGGQVLTWQPNEQHPIFWLSKDAIYQSGKSIRGGIPLCWPWFGAYDFAGKSDNTKNHGFARQSMWQLENIEITAKGVYISVVLQGKNLAPLWPHAFKLTQQLFFGEQFKQTLVMKNNSAKAINYNCALHSYFQVSSPKNISIPTLAHSDFYDKLTAKNEIGQAKVSCIGAIDRIYHSSKTMQIFDENWQRIINISTENTQQWVLWNPGKKSAEAMVDVHQHGESEYICLEAANTDWQSIAAHDEVTIAQKISITSLCN